MSPVARAGKPFPLPAWRKRLDRQRFQRQQSVIRSTCDAMEAVMRDACLEVVRVALATGEFRAPDLSGFDPISRQFYWRVIGEAFRQAESEKASMKGRRKLSSPLPGAPESRQGGAPGDPGANARPLSRVRLLAPPGASPEGVRRLAGLPSGKVPLRQLVAFFQDKRRWGPIDRRRQKLIDRLRKAYLLKLQRKFREVVPSMLSGEKSPAKAQEELMEAWHASRARVGTIFDTETTKYFCQTQVAFFEGDPEIIGFLFDSVRDTSRTEICRCRHGLIFKPGSKLLRANTPALHWRCRSHLIALADTEYNRKLLEDPERDPERKTLVPLPKGWKK